MFIDKNNNIEKIIVFSLFIIFETVIMKLSGISIGYYSTCIFVLASGYYSRAEYFTASLLTPALLFTFFYGDPEIMILFVLWAAGISIGIIYKSMSDKLSESIKKSICCAGGSIIKLVICLALLNGDLLQLMIIFFLDMAGSFAVIKIIDEYIAENRVEAKKHKIKNGSDYLQISKKRLRKMILTKNYLCSLGYDTGFVLDSLDKLSEFCRNDPFTAREMIRYIKNYIKIASAGNNGFIELDKELELLHAYIKIVKLKYDDKITVNMKACGVIPGVYIPAAIIERMVENSIFYGLMPKALGGEIFIDINVTDDRVGIIVKDTGIGLDSVSSESAFEDNMKNLGKVYRSLFNLYRNNFKMEIYSMIEEGMTINIEIPKTDSI